jgi:hypothetical protein
VTALTLQEARERSRLLDVRGYRIELDELLAGYVPRYFFALAEAAAGGEAGLARAWCMHGFPHHAADTATVQAGERCLETGAMGQGSGSLRRLLADQVEDLRRSAAVRSAY